jgi:uncharacterized protein
MRKMGLIATAALLMAGLLFWNRTHNDIVLPSVTESLSQIIPPHPLSIEGMRKGDYPGSEITYEATLSAQPSYNQYIVSYRSDNYRIQSLLTVPRNNQPENGFPVIIFNHGYIPPEEYRTTERYVAYVNSLAAAGYVVMKPDYRGHGESEGNPEGAYYSPAYTRDVLNAIASVKTLDFVDPDRIGMWGHSMGGHIVLRSMVVNPDIKAGVIWGGVVTSYQDMMSNWNRSRPWQPSEREQATRRSGRQTFIEQYGSPEQNKVFWDSISPIAYVSDVSGPIQIHHGLADDVVPHEFSQSLHEALESAGKTSEYFAYQGGDHNLSGADFNIAMQRTVDFYKQHL